MAANASNYALLIASRTGSDPLVTLLSKAKISILVETRALTDPVIAGALKSARDHGVDVRVMTDPHSASSGPVLASLASADVLTRRGNPAFNLTGESAVMIDRTTLVLTNAPLTVEAQSSDRRFFLVDFDRLDVQQASTVFYDDWVRRTPSVFGTSTVLGPVTYNNSVIDAINRAVNSLDIMVGALSSNDVMSALSDAIHRQVAVRVLLDSSAPPSLVQSLLSAGATVRMLGGGFFGSAIAVDDARLLLGSASLTDISLRQNRELGLLVKDGSVSALYASVFGASWRAATPINAPTMTPTPAPTFTPTNTPRPTATPKGYHPTKTPTPKAPTRTATPTRPRATSTPRPTATAPATPVPSKLALDVTFNASVRIGGTQQITVRTLPNAQVSIVVTYPDGTYTNVGTKAGNADAAGTFLDSWPVSLTTVPGPAKATIVVSSGALRKSQTINFRITF